MKPWSINDGSRFREILGYCHERFQPDLLLMAVRPSSKGKGPYALPVPVIKWARSTFQKSLIAEFSAHLWPGSRLINHRGHIMVVRYDKTTMNKLLEVEPDLFAWRHAHRWRLPEDLCLLKTRRNLPCLVSVTHESDAWIIDDQKPAIEGIEASRFSLEDFQFSPGRYFCA